MSLAAAHTAPGLTVRALHPALGAEVTGLDLRRPLDSATMKAVHDAWMEHLVLVFPRQRLTDEEQIAFSRQFGDLEVHHQAILKSSKTPEIFRVSNVDENGTLLPPTEKTVAQLSVTRYWHTDSSFRANPSMGSLLRCVEVARSGGMTCFTNMYRVWEDLPERLKAQVRGRRARHDFEFLTTLAPTRTLTDAERAAMPPVWQPLVRRHPVTGRVSLYISPIYNDAVDGLERAAAGRLIAELTEMAGRTEYVYPHRWEADDLMIWDNRCTMHRVTPYDPAERRVMHRTTVVGDGAVIAA